MPRHYEAVSVNEALPTILKDLLDNGDEVGSRNGRVVEFTNAQITLLAPTNREVLCLNRKANVFAQIAETMWVLAGRNDIKWLSAYLPRAVDYSDDGFVWRGGYGPRIRNFNGVDQLAYVVDTLKRDPLSRQAVIVIYDPTDTEPGLDRPCNTFLQFQSRLGVLHMTVTVRSNDVMWGWSGINAFEWSTIQEIVATLLRINVGTLTFNVGSLHLYEQHWRKAASIEPDPVDYFQIPFDGDDKIRDLGEVDSLVDRWFAWEDLCRTGNATPELLEDFGETLFKAWGAAIAYYWTQDKVWLFQLQGTALAAAIARTPVNLLPEPVVACGGGAVALTPTKPTRDPGEAFYAFVTDLHAKKHASYGDSWKKRGEMLSILPNIARKIDRLGVGDEYDSSADTVIDLWVYLAKYLCWLSGNEADPHNVNAFLESSLRNNLDILGNWQIEIPKRFNLYADAVGGANGPVDSRVEAKRLWIHGLLEEVAPIAFDLWYAENEYRGADHA